MHFDNNMSIRKIVSSLVVTILLIALAHQETVNLNNQPARNIVVTVPVKLATFPADFDMVNKGTPWLTL